MKKDTLIAQIDPKSGSTILIYDVHASESGALAILNDLYQQIRDYPDKSVYWVFAVSTPAYDETKNIKILRYPWVKKNWGYRYYFDSITTRTILKEYKPDKVFSLQNKGIFFYNGPQLVYLHLPSILTEYRFNMKHDGKTLWAHQNVLKKGIFQSFRKADKIIVQTNWMKQALIEKAHVSEEKIVLQLPDISKNNIGTFVDSLEHRKTFFYPATAFTYKNHLTLLKAICYAQKQGFNDYKVIFTIRSDENKYTRQLYQYTIDNKLHVDFHGQVSRECVFELYTKSVLLFPSFVESFGLPLLEARMSETHVIASDCPFSREILDGYEKAYYFPAMDYKKMGECILAIQNQTR